MARKIIYIVGGIVVLLLLVVVLLPFVIDANRFRPEIESSLNSALNRKVDIGNIRLSILSGGVTVENVSISDDPSFNTGPFLKAKSLSVNLELLPLIFSRAIHVTGLTIDEPSVTLLRSQSGPGTFLLWEPARPKPKVLALQHRAALPAAPARIFLSEVFP